MTKDKLSIVPQGKLTRACDVATASLALGLYSPFIIGAAIRSYFKSESLFKKEIALDALHRPVHQLLLRNSEHSNIGLYLSVLKGQLSIVGLDRLPTDSRLVPHDISPENSKAAHPAGLFSLASNHRSIGLLGPSETLSLEQQFQSLQGFTYFKTLAKTALCSLLYKGKKLKSEASFYLFGLKIDNHSMSEAIDWLFDKPEQGCETAVFVNVNSVNLSHEQAELRHAINSANKVFADGSGVRMGARKLGIALKGNVNGTDMLPILCREASSTSKRLFLYGAAPGVAAKAADKLRKKYPGLRIVGVQHGFANTGNNDKLEQQTIDSINNSKADILLLGLGSPLQEQWLKRNRHKLKVDKALAVGGLFDYYSGNIPRAPLFLRELGFEWLWRLFQEPSKKFYRYVIGNPLYLFRLLRLKRQL
ncbi:WecB/TagA/CpsF family glycosyltransferase [uncultured Pseudoteredinibacter sp.]|uniref:WecB/TagA/CpsF family glycosyltransferase n=1 Tax=uncultured Pseudoteredinibacter sp. TaxID=1641701 RepID=UPI00261FF91A|nr:WecB/TagA/CpsF family glycosyltransferase [uncultured Pseudoteredinibacter sp.]